MPAAEIKSVIIAGGGTAGWMAASAIAKIMGPRLGITLIESDEIGIIGVGEATIPSIALFNEMLRIDENEFLRQTQGTFKLGIEFVNWYKSGHRYMHAFGPVGKDLAYIPFHHYWLRDWLQGQRESLWNYSLNWLAASQNRYARLPHVPDSPLQGLVHAYHFDASLYAAYLRQLAQKMGVRRVEGTVTEALRDPDSGDVRALKLKSGQELGADFFVDCTGFRGLLIEQTLNTGYDDWSHWLRCDRALAVPTERTTPLTPYTRSTALQAGWQWRIPLQHRVGNGHVYSSAYLSDERALEQLNANLDSKALADPRPIRFVAGRRRETWSHNVVCLGLASGFLEPLESTSIHLIQSNLQRLILMFPRNGDNTHRRNEFNKAAATEYEYVRDFIILHYYANNRVGERFWDDCRNMAVPDSLTHKIELFRETGGIFCAQHDLFQLTSWLQVLWGQGVQPRSAHPFVETIVPRDREGYLKDLRVLLAHTAAGLPTHEEYIARHCPAPPLAVRVG